MLRRSQQACDAPLLHTGHELTTELRPVEAIGTSREGLLLPGVELCERGDQGQHAFGQSNVSVEQAKAHAILEGHAGQGGSHRHDRQAIEHIVEGP